MPAIQFDLPTALLLIDNQQAFDVPLDKPSHWGNHRSNPNYEKNLTTLLNAFRAARNDNNREEKKANIQEIIHIFHSSTSPTSPLHPSHPSRGIEPLPFATPARDGTERVMWKHVNSAFIGTELETVLREKGIRQLVVAGITTDHCVSTSVRMAANLGVVERKGDGDDGDGDVLRGRILLVEDATATWDKGGFDAETVHRVTVASLDGEFADVVRTDEVVRGLSSSW